MIVQAVIPATRITNIKLPTMMTVLEKMGFFECSVVLLGSRVESGSGVVADTITPLPPLSLSKIQLSYLHQKEQQAHKPIAREIKIPVEMHISGYSIDQQVVYTQKNLSSN